MRSKTEFNKKIKKISIKSLLSSLKILTEIISGIKLFLNGLTELIDLAIMILEKFDRE